MASRALAQKPEYNSVPASPIEASSPTEGISPLTRQYVVPPRPKPGRKPATDTPPTKRKAQNRAAQRAFRERRAQKVHELEDDIHVMRKQHEADLDQLQKAHEVHLRDIDMLNRKTIHELSREAALWRQKSIGLQAMLDEMRKGPVSNEDAQRSYQTPPTIQDGCGKCTTDSECPCVDEAFEVNVAAEPKRPPSSHTDQGVSKRQRTYHPEELEVDFTNFAQPIPPSNRKPSVPGPHIEPCGFCSDGRTCICAELTFENAQPASTTDIESSCAENPGSCGTCKSDPKFSIMCQALYSSKSHETQSKTLKQQDSEPCALGKACCQVSSTIEETRTQCGAGSNSNSSSHEPTISCRKAFDTLSQHRAFDKAREDLGTWLPMLKTIPTKSHHQSEALGDNEISSASGQISGQEPSYSPLANLTGFEIEAASVLSVLSYYDHRYSSNQS